MEAVKVCQHFKFGHCKFGNFCRNRHVITICEDMNCDISLCRNRHPRPCKFYQNYGRCKFSPCSFKHEENKWEEQNRSLNNLKNEIEEKCVEMENMKTEIEKLTKLCDLLSKRIPNDYVCQAQVMPSLQRVEAKMDAVTADVDSLKELTSLLKLQNKVSDDDFHTYSQMVDKLQKNVLHIEKYLCRRSSSNQAHASPSSIPPTPPPSISKPRP